MESTRTTISTVNDAAAYLVEQASIRNETISMMRLNSLIYASIIDAIPFDIVLVDEVASPITGFSGVDGRCYGVAFPELQLYPDADSPAPLSILDRGSGSNLTSRSRAIIDRAVSVRNHLLDYDLADRMYQQPMLAELRKSIAAIEEPIPPDLYHRPSLDVASVISYRFGSAEDFIPIEAIARWVARRSPAGASGHRIHNITFLIARRALGSGIGILPPKGSKGLSAHSHGVYVDNITVPLTEAIVTHEQLVLSSRKKELDALYFHLDPFEHKVRFFHHYWRQFHQITDWQIASLVRNDRLLGTKTSFPLSFTWQEFHEYHVNQILGADNE